MLPVHRCRGANPLGDLSVLLLVVTVMTLGSSSPSWAQGGANGGVGKNDFGIDGNLLANSPANGPNPGDPSTADDWLDGLAGPGVGVLNKNGTPRDPAHTRHGVDGTRLNADLTVFEGSNKIDDNPNTYEWKDGSVPQKDDIQNCLFHFSVEPNGSLWVNAAGDRLATNGDSYIDVELLQGTLTTVPDPIDPTHGDFVSSGPDGGRTVGDLLLTIELVRGGAQAEVFAMQWVAGGGPEGFHYEPIDLGNNAFVAANVESTVVVPYGAFGNTTYEINAFGEMSANLTELLGLECFGINTIFMRTKSSQSEDAELKDFFEPFTLEACLDQVPPTITCAPVTSPIECPATPVFPDPEVSDNCDTDVAVTFEDVTTPGDCAQEYTVTRTWTATDACGNTATCVQVVEVRDTTAPDINCPTAKSPIECPGVPSFPDPIVSDACDADPDVTFEDVTTPGDCPQEYLVTRTWTARDACGNSSTCSQTVEVQDTTAPDISCPTAKSPIECPGVPSFPDPIVSDACDADPDVTFEDVTTPGDCPQEYLVTRTWTARDACGNSSTCSQTVEVQDTTAPDISCPTAKSPIECPGVPSFPDPIVSDTCDPNPRVTFVDETTPGDCPLYTVTRTWTATDACGNSSSCSQSVEVRDTTAPDISCPTAKSPIECPGVPSFPDPIVSDACDPNPEVTFEDVTTPGDCPQEYIVTRTWTARDACGNPSSCSQSVEVQDTTAPDITCADVKSPIECPGTPVFPPPDVTDACDADPDVTYEDVTTPGKCPQEYIVTRIWTARDACGNSATCTQSVEVQDTTDPTITCPLAIEVECGEEVPPPDTELVVCDDTCDDSPSTEFVSDVSNGAQCPDPEVITRTYRCTDACGNSAECTQTITVLCCPSDHFCTLTQGAYGTAGGTYNGQGTLSLIQSLLSGSDLVVGKPGRSITIPQAAAQCIINRLPAGGTAGSLPNIGDDTLAHPTCQTTPAIPLNNLGNFNNVLIGQTIALGLNLRLDPNLEDFELAKQFCTKGALPGPDGLFCTDDDVIDPNSPVQSFTIPNAVITALSNLGLSNDVEGLLELANRALAAQATGGATATQINSAVDAINRGFDKGRFIVPCPLGLVASKPEDLELTIFGIPAAEAAPSVGPAHYELGQSNPNPFNPHTRITLSLPEATSWTLDIYNVSGQLVRRFEGQVDGAEYVPVVWDGTNRNGEPVAPGVYLYRMNAGGFSATKKMILLK